MPKEPIEKPNPPTEEPSNESLVLFNKGTSTLPAAVQRAIERSGLKLKSRELPGVAPSWKPTTPGEFVFGEILAIREGVGEFAGTVIVLSTKDGPVSVWVGVDLKTKFGSNVRVGQVYCIQYMGKILKSQNPKLKKDMHQFQVAEIIPEA